MSELGGIQRGWSGGHSGPIVDIDQGEGVFSNELSEFLARGSALEIRCSGHVVEKSLSKNWRRVEVLAHRLRKQARSARLRPEFTIWVTWARRGWRMGEGCWFGFRELVSELGEERGVPVTGTRFCASAVFPHIVYAPSDDMTVAACAPRVCSDSWASGMGGTQGCKEKGDYPPSASRTSTVGVVYLSVAYLDVRVCCGRNVGPPRCGFRVDRGGGVGGRHALRVRVVVAFVGAASFV
jgi:hypothetical protein